MQVQHDSQVQPSLTRPNVTVVARPLMVWRICDKVPIQQVRRYVELMVAVGCHLLFAGPDHGYSALTHQTTNTTMANIQTDLLQLFSHPWPTVAAKAETILLLDVRKRD